MFRAVGQTDMTKLIVVFRNFANAPKNCPGTELELFGIQRVSLWKYFIRLMLIYQTTGET